MTGWDGCYRDLASVHARHHQVQETIPALTLAGEWAQAHGVSRCVWWLDRPISNSGRLRQTMLAKVRTKRANVVNGQLPFSARVAFIMSLSQMSETDWELLSRYVRDQADDAFAAIAQNYVNLVYSAALRQVRAPQLAEEVVQSTFIDLARSAAKLPPDTILTAWLYKVASRTAVDVLRRESRRQRREQIAHDLAAMNATPTDWDNIEPLLDEAMNALDEPDRTAVLLRYFNNRSLREVGTTLGISEDAAQKRATRAVERLRRLFAGKGLSIGASGIAGAIAANAIQAAPVGLSAAIATASIAAVAGSTLAATTAMTVTKVVAMTTLQKTMITGVLSIAVGTGIYQARQASRLRDELAQLRQLEADAVKPLLTPEEARQYHLRMSSTARQLVNQCLAPDLALEEQTRLIENMRTASAQSIEAVIGEAGRARLEQAGNDRWLETLLSLRVQSATDPP